MKIHLTILFLVFSLIGDRAAAAADITIMAAISTSAPLNKALSTVCQKELPDHINLIVGASGQLAAQIEKDGGGDLFISASEDWLHYLSKKDLVVPTLSQGWWRNHLVLIREADNYNALLSWQDLPGYFDKYPQARLALGDPVSVPQGYYAKQALVQAHLWDRLNPVIVMSLNAEQTIRLVERGEADFALIYASDAMGRPNIRVIDTPDRRFYQPITYPMAFIKPSQTREEVIKLATCLQSPKVAAIFREYGFVP